MPINIPETVRGWLYVFCIFGSLIAGYLGVKGIIGADELSLWSGVAAAIATMARFNLSHGGPTDTTPTDDAIVMRRPNQ